MLIKALTAVNRLIPPGLEGNLRRAAAAIAYDIVHLAGTIASSVTAFAIAAIGPAGRATSRFVGETLLGKESLFGSGKGEFGATVTAYKGFVGVHG